MRRWFDADLSVGHVSTVMYVMHCQLPNCVGAGRGSDSHLMTRAPSPRALLFSTVERGPARVLVGSSHRASLRKTVAEPSRGYPTGSAELIRYVCTVGERHCAIEDTPHPVNDAPCVT